MMDIRIEWHSPDQIYAAVFMRDGEPWYLEGALVGMDSPPGRAVDDLVELAQYLVIHGYNALTEVDVPLDDRKWLFKLLDDGGDWDTTQTMYTALRDAFTAQQREWKE
jgi:hypothetical protein